MMSDADILKECEADALTCSLFPKKKQEVREHFQ